MKAKFTQNDLGKIDVTGKGYWITDEGCPNLRLFVGASGKKTWYVSYWKDGRKQSHKLGPAGPVSVTVAREGARKFLARLTLGEAPVKKIEKKLQFGEFIETYYGPWVEANRKSGKETMAILRSQFRFIFKQPIDELKTLELEKWRMKRQEGKTKASTLNRQITALKAALNWGVERKHITSNPLNHLKRLSERDSNKKLRFLYNDERARLLAALDERETRLRIERESHNKWLTVRGKEARPSLDGDFADYLKPLVLLAMNTGIRKSDILALTWGDVDFDTGLISFVAGKTEDSSGEILHIPMIETVINTLTAWRKQSVDTSPGALIFPSTKKKGAQIVSIKRAWGTLLKNAQIENFRWHDLRHDFASQLAMKKADLIAIKELLGHADIKTTMKYAHLSSESKLKAIQLLGSVE